MVKEAEKTKLDFKMQAWLMGISVLAKRPVEMRTKEIAELFEISPRKVQTFISAIGFDDPFLRITSPMRGHYIFTNTHNTLTPVSRHVDPVLYADWREWYPECGGDMAAYIVSVYALFDRALGIKKSPFPKLYDKYEANGRIAKMFNNANEIIKFDGIKRTEGSHNGHYSHGFGPKLTEKEVNSFALNLRSFALSYGIQQWDANKVSRLSYYIKYIYIYLLDLQRIILILRSNIDSKMVYNESVRSLPPDPEEFEDAQKLETMKLAVVDVCKSNILLISDEQIEGAQKLVAAGITPHQLRACYGKDRKPNYWYTSHWKGQRHQWPTIQDILSTVVQALEYVPHFADEWPGSIRIQEQFYEVMRKNAFDTKAAKKDLDALGYLPILERIVGGYYHLATVSQTQANILIANAVKAIKEEVLAER